MSGAVSAMDKIDLSIIVPVYNEEEHVVECLTQIITKANNSDLLIEIIVVDDCSSDRSWSLLQTLQPSIRLYQTKNNSGGAGVPRNIGLSNAQGRYITFYDLGDVIDIGVISRSVETMDLQGVDLLVSKHIDITPDDEIQHPLAQLFEKDMIVNFNEMPALIHNPFAWSKIYRASFIRAHQINFGDQYCGEDKVFTWKCYLYASRIYVSKLVMYGHRFFSAQINRMLQRNIKLVESIIEIDAVMRPHFKTKNLENLYDIRLFARDVSGIVLSSESVKILKQNQEYEKAIKLLESWMRVVFESRGVEISKVINASTKRNIMEHFPSFEKILNESEVTQYEFTNRWFESKAKNIWIQLLPKFQPKRILEIGSYEGASTCFLIEFLSKNGGGEIHCIDTWEGGIEHKNGGTAEINMSEVELRFRKNVDVAMSSYRHVECFFHKGYSNVELVRLLNKLNQGYFDFIYIDGSHQAPDVLMDAVLSFNLLKKGGLMAFDDYLWSEPLAGGPDLLRCPKPAIDAFTNIFFRKIKIISAPLYQLYLQKIEN